MVMTHLERFAVMTVIVGPKTMICAILILLFIVRPFLPLVNPYIIESNHKSEILSLNKEGYKCAKYDDDKLIIFCDTDTGK